MCFWKAGISGLATESWFYLDAYIFSLPGNVTSVPGCEAGPQALREAFYFRVLYLIFLVLVWGYFSISSPLGLIQPGLFALQTLCLEKVVQVLASSSNTSQQLRRLKSRRNFLPRCQQKTRDKWCRCQGWGKAKILREEQSEQGNQPGHSAFPMVSHRWCLKLFRARTSLSLSLIFISHLSHIF